MAISNRQIKTDDGTGKMTSSSDSKRDFFVSFNQADRNWAAWITWVLEVNGYSVFFQDWDFRGNLIEQMGQAHRRAARTLVVLSDNYLRSEYARSEARVALARDPAGLEDRTVTVKVGPTGDLGLFSPFAYLDLTGSTEADAERLLLERARKALDPTYRQKPTTRPRFHDQTATKPPFPVLDVGSAFAVHNLRPANPDFVGREEPLAELRRLLTSGQGPAVLTQAITGLGGIGKTQMALAYAWRHLADYQLVWWLRAEGPATLAADYAALAEPLGLDPAAADQQSLIAAIREALPNRALCLLIFDNVEEPILPRAYLPRTGVHALITSRRTDWQGIARALPLGVMPEAEALRLLARFPDMEVLSSPELAEAKALVRELGYLPLALAQAGAYMRATGASFGSYRTLLAKSRTKLLREDRWHPDYPEPVAHAWDISVHAAEQQCAAARPLLELFAFFASEPLPRAVLDAEPTAFPKGLRDELARNRALGALIRFSLIGTQDGSIVVHRLVQAVTRDGLDEATAKDRAGAAVRLAMKAMTFDTDNPSEWPKMQALLPHVLAVSIEAERLGVGLAAAATILNQTALYYQARAAWAEAEPLLERSLAITEKALGPEHPSVAITANNLAGLYQATGRYAEAEPLLKHVLSILEKALGPEHPSVAITANNLAGLYQATGRYAEAEPLLEHAVAIGERTLGPEHPDLATRLNNLALLYRSTSRYAEAGSLYERAVAIDEKAYGPDHPEVATDLNNLAGLYQATGRYAEAEPLFLRALAILEKTLGPEHPSVAITANNLAGLYQATDRYAEAEPLLKRAIAIGEKTLGPEHPDLATRLNNLALLYRDTARYAEAEPLYQRALAIAEKALGPEHPDLATGFNNLASLYQDTGRYAEAEPLYQRAIAIGEKTLGPEHPDLANRLDNLAGLYRDTGRYEEAEPLYQRAIAITEKTLGPEHPNLAAGLNNLASLYQDTGRYEQAEPLYERAIAIGEKALGPEHPALATWLNNLAGLYRSTGRYAQAEPLYERAIAILDKSLPSDHPNLAVVRENYAPVLDQLGRADEASELRAEAETIRQRREQAQAPP